MEGDPPPVVVVVPRFSGFGPLSLPRLHPRTIEAVKERADIVDVVGEHVVLKKRGREFVGKAEIARWNTNENIGVSSRIEVTDVDRSDDQTTIGVQRVDAADKSQR